VSNRIINEVRGINRVTYDISGKPPATIEWDLEDTIPAHGNVAAVHQVMEIDDGSARINHRSVGQLRHAHLSTIAPASPTRGHPGERREGRRAQLRHGSRAAGRDRKRRG
jgi:hypothetical protein